MLLCAADCGLQSHDHVDPIPIDLVTECPRLGAELIVGFYVADLHMESIPFELGGFDCTHVGRIYRPGFLLVPHPNLLEGRFLVECENDGQTCCEFTQVSR